MLLGWHAGDYPPLPDEARFADAVRPLAIPPGDYMVPRPRSMADMRSPEFIEKRKTGPVMMITVFPTGLSGMGRNLAMWFVYSLVVSLFAAYVAVTALSFPGATIAQPGKWTDRGMPREAISSWNTRVCTGVAFRPPSSGG